MDNQKLPSKFHLHLDSSEEAVRLLGILNTAQVEKQPVVLFNSDYYSLQTAYQAINQFFGHHGAIQEQEMFRHQLNEIKLAIESSRLSGPARKQIAPAKTTLQKSLLRTLAQNVNKSPISDALKPILSSSNTQQVINESLEQVLITFHERGLNNMGEAASAAIKLAAQKLPGLSVLVNQLEGVTNIHEKIIDLAKDRLANATGNLKTAIKTIESGKLYIESHDAPQITKDLITKEFERLKISPENIEHFMDVIKLHSITNPRSLDPGSGRSYLTNLFKTLNLDPRLAYKVTNEFVSQVVEFTNHEVAQSITTIPGVAHLTPNQSPENINSAKVVWNFLKGQNLSVTDFVIHLKNLTTQGQATLTTHQNQLTQQTQDLLSKSSLAQRVRGIRLSQTNLTDLLELFSEDELASLLNKELSKELLGALTKKFPGFNLSSLSGFSKSELFQTFSTAFKQLFAKIAQQLAVWLKAAATQIGSLIGEGVAAAGPIIGSIITAIGTISIPGWLIAAVVIGIFFAPLIFDQIQGMPQRAALNPPLESGGGLAETNPFINVTKTANPTILEDPIGKITYTYTINAPQGTLTNVQVSDKVLMYQESGQKELEIDGEVPTPDTTISSYTSPSFTLTLKPNMDDAAITNTITVTATAPDGSTQEVVGLATTIIGQPPFCPPTLAPVDSPYRSGWAYGGQNTGGTCIASDNPTTNGHQGIDLGGGFDVRSAFACPATVVYSGYSEPNGFGQYVALQSGPWYTFYAHLEVGSSPWKVGQLVGPGETLGVMDSTGNSSGNHLHYEIRNSDKGGINVGSGCQPNVSLDPCEVQGASLGSASCNY